MRDSHLIQIPKLPKFPHNSPEIVFVLDKIRYKLDADETLGEFCWFAREYPRINRYHLDHAKLRLCKIHDNYLSAYEYWLFSNLSGSKMEKFLA